MNLTQVVLIGADGALAFIACVVATYVCLFVADIAKRGRARDASARLAAQDFAPDSLAADENPLSVAAGSDADLEGVGDGAGFSGSRYL